ncbi:hypothetical protein CRUP_016431 [Coryphaenoides rupestris]|nr:hypothetical protein CRUP_016431 [Coryphaenoides rupestris]
MNAPLQVKQIRDWTRRDHRRHRQQQQQQQQRSGNNTSVAMSQRMVITKLGHFIESPPAGFSVETQEAGCRVTSDPEHCMVLIDDFESDGAAVVFQNSLGRTIEMRNLWEYTRIRRTVLSKRIYLLMTLCQEDVKTPTGGLEVLGRYVVSVDGSDPLVMCQMEKGLDWTISSVAGESYRVDWASPVVCHAAAGYGMSSRAEAALVRISTCSL